MSEFIRICTPQATKEAPHRLNLFPGRYLSEREFELLQTYVDERIAPLSTTVSPGIIQGLEIGLEGTGNALRITAQPGLALTEGGAMVRLIYPLAQRWSDLLAASKPTNTQLRNGLYWLTVRAQVESIDDTTDEPPCTRQEPDPLRQRRLETVVLLGLQFASDAPTLLSRTQEGAANEICVEYLNKFPTDQGAVPVGLVKVINETPEWIDTVAGRYLSGEASGYRTLLAHYLAVLDRWSEKNTPPVEGATLAKQLGIDHLPAAGPLPASFLKTPGTQPGLAFDPYDLQVELAPIPASTIHEVIECELPRGSINLVDGWGDRIRLLLAISDLDYRHDLLDLPQRDTALEEELFHRDESAAQAWADWLNQWKLLFRGLNTEQMTKFHAPAPVARPMEPDTFRTSLVTQRNAAAKTEGIVALPEPYLTHQTTPYSVSNYKKITEPANPAEQLLIEREKQAAIIRALEEDLRSSYRLIEEVTDYLTLQRHHTDSLSIAFSTLAGGVPGDGSGAKLMRWSGNVMFDPTTTT